MTRRKRIILTLLLAMGILLSAVLVTKSLREMAFQDEAMRRGDDVRVRWWCPEEVAWSDFMPRCIRVLLRDVVTVRLTHEPISAEYMAALGRHRTIESLRFDARNVKDEHVFTLLPKLPHLRGLSLDNTQISDVALQAVARLKRLDGLSLAFTQVSDEGIERLASSPLAGSLTSLDLAATSISDEALRHVSGFGKLNWLEIGDTPITDGAFVHLKNHPTISFVMLEGIPCGPVALDALISMPRLKHVGISDDVPDEWEYALLAARPNLIVQRNRMRDMDGFIQEDDPHRRDAG